MDEYGHCLSKNLNKDKIKKSILALTDAKKLWVAYSGGLDSHVLLHLTADAFSNNSEYQIGAIHVHHGLSQFADEWVLQCQKVCVSLHVPLTVLYVDATVKEGRSPEEVAREARIKAWKNFLGEDECLLLAHHEQDQAETILLRLFRGAGPLGLSGMRPKAKIGHGVLIRPLLSIPKEAIINYGQEHALSWIEDDSNINTRFDRNFLRQDILPLLVSRWPRALKSITRSGALCLETALASHIMASNDLPFVQIQNEKTLSVSRLLELELPRRFGVIRLWLHSLGFAFPSRDHMERIDREVLKAKPDSKPRLKISRYEISRKKDQLMVHSL